MTSWAWPLSSTHPEEMFWHCRQGFNQIACVAQNKRTLTKYYSLFYRDTQKFILNFGKPHMCTSPDSAFVCGRARKHGSVDASWPLPGARLLAFNFKDNGLRCGGFFKSLGMRGHRLMGIHLRKISPEETSADQCTLCSRASHIVIGLLSNKEHQRIASAEYKA